ncbi:MAG: ATP-binding protein [Candidatus Bathyarchaeota archaeon]|nr:ATP-binding protein [Candidatus Bathyarchaeota archaeon]
MKQLTVLSGKGGTGKTSLTASFAVLAKHAVVADCDVDAPDLHMLLHPQVISEQDFVGSKLATIDQEKCVKCGLCKKSCHFDAITSSLEVDAVACEGCGVCKIVCPADAVTFAPRVSGKAFISKTKYGFMSHAQLFPGEANSGKLVTLVRQNAKVIAEKEGCGLVIIDGSPGIGCPVIASIAGVDAALVVSEPTLSGIHDLTRVLQLLKHFNVQPFICVNMHDINAENTKKIMDYCKENSVEIVGTVSYNAKFTEAMVNGQTVVEYAPESVVSQQIRGMWSQLFKVLNADTK